MDETGSPQEKVFICDRNTLTGQGRTHGTGAHRGVLRRLKKSHGARGPESASLVCVHFSVPMQFTFLFRVSSLRRLHL